ncbi:MAG: DNA-binding protein WhiA [Lachnospiraceae bacterium]|jgi:DNA-binding protein WhiA|nr:DNA-binding protein WhiA [Lachnospiraceae bacterium]
MSFSSRVKDELAEIYSSARHCQIAEIAAMLSMDGKILNTGKNSPIVVLATENLPVARKCFTLLRKTFNINTEVSVRRGTFLQKNGNYTLLVSNPEDVEKLLSATRMTPLPGTGQWIPGKLILQNDCCRRAFLRGAYLACGSMSNPEKGYHFEISCTAREKAEQLCQVFASFGVDARIILRKKYYVLYVKEGDQIVDILNIMAAHVALLELENIRILKGVRETVNRQVNCETANLGKTTSAACGQMNDILLIQKRMGLQNLPKLLRDTATARLNWPDASLKELGDLMDPPVGKSGVNHRLRKLKELADSLRVNEEDVSC